MKRTLLATAVLMAFLALGCKTFTPSDLAGTIAMMDAEVPLIVAVVVSEEPDTVGHFRAAAALIETMAEADTVDATALVANVKLLQLSPKAEMAIFVGVGIWRAYAARNPDATPTEIKLLLQVLARDIRAGLPPAKVETLRRVANRSR